MQISAFRLPKSRYLAVRADRLKTFLRLPIGLLKYPYWVYESPSGWPYFALPYRICGIPTVSQIDIGQADILVDSYLFRISIDLDPCRPSQLSFLALRTSLAEWISRRARISERTVFLSTIYRILIYQLDIPRCMTQSTVAPDHLAVRIGFLLLRVLFSSLVDGFLCIFTPYFAYCSKSLPKIGQKAISIDASRGRQINSGKGDTRIARHFQLADSHLPISISHSFVRYFSARWDLSFAATYAYGGCPDSLP